jgi:hypothetical protein
MNLTNCWMMATHSALSKGLNFAISPSLQPTEDILADVEMAVSTMLVEAAEEVQQEAVKILRMSKELKRNIRMAKKWALQILWGNADLTILRADKGNAMVVFNTADYTEKVLTLLDELAYNKLTKDPTQSTEQKTTLLIKGSSFPEDVSE